MDEFDELMSAAFQVKREVTDVDEAVLVAHIHKLLHCDDDEHRAVGIRAFEKYVTSNEVARQRTAIKRIRKAKSLLEHDDIGAQDEDGLRERIAGVATILGYTLDGLARSSE